MCYCSRPKGESLTHIPSNRCHLPEIAVQSRVAHQPNQPKQGGTGAKLAKAGWRRSITHDVTRDIAAETTRLYKLAYKLSFLKAN